MLGANVPTKELHRELKKKGWQLSRTAGDHDVFTHPEAKHHLSIPRHRQLKAPLVMKVLKAMKVNESKVLSFLQFCIAEDASKYMDSKPSSVTSDQATDYKKRADRAFKPEYYEPDDQPPPKRRDWDYDDEDVKPIVKKYLEKMIDKKPATSPTPSESYDIGEADYQGRNVPLNKPMAGDVKKSKVFVRNAEGNVVKVNFGDKNMTIKKNIPARRKSFRARHNCEEPGPKTKARYWSCKAW